MTERAQADRKAITRRQLLDGALVAAAAASLPRAAAAGVDTGTDALVAGIEAILRRDQVPAAGVAVVRGQEQLLARGFGTANLGCGAPATEKTLFHIGSIGKHITAAAVIRLVEQGQVALSDPIGRHVEGLPESWRSRPLISLLTHSSGIPDYEDGVAWDRHYDREAFVRLASAKEPNFPAGAAWSYSNTGYVLLGYLLENVTGRNYPDIIAQDLFAGIGLSEARPDAAETVIPGRAEPYVVTSTGIRHATRMNNDLSAWPDGGVLMSARDWCRWEPSLHDGRTLSAAGRQMMFGTARYGSGLPLPYALGWLRRPVGRGRELWWHSGGVPGFTSLVLRVPGADLGILVATSADGGYMPGAIDLHAPRDIALLLAEHYAPGSTPASSARIRDQAPALTRRIVAQLGRGAGPIDRQLFAPEALHLIDAGLEDDALPNLGKQAMPQEISLVADVRAELSRTRIYRLAFEKRSSLMWVDLTPQGQIFDVKTF